MTKREAKIIALKEFGNSTDVLIDNMVIKNLDDCDKLNIAFDEVANELLNRARKLEERTQKRKSNASR